MIRRSLTPPIGIPIPGQLPARRAGGPRRNVSYRVTLRRGPAEIPGWALNLSRGGLRAIIEDQVALGEVLEVEIADEALRLSGRVVWTQEEPDGMVVGLSFLERIENPPPGMELDASVEIGPGEAARKLGMSEDELRQATGQATPAAADTPAREK